MECSAWATPVANDTSAAMATAQRNAKPRFDLRFMTALFSIDSPTATILLAAAKCVLIFEQFNQTYRIPCTVSDLDRDNPAWQATYWHNHMFNPALPGAVRVLAFTPEWNAAEVDPWPAPDGACEPGD